MNHTNRQQKQDNSLDTFLKDLANYIFNVLENGLIFKQAGTRRNQIEKISDEEKRRKNLKKFDQFRDRAEAQLHEDILSKYNLAIIKMQVSRQDLIEKIKKGTFWKPFVEEGVRAFLKGYLSNFSRVKTPEEKFKDNDIDWVMGPECLNLDALNSITGMDQILQYFLMLETNFGKKEEKKNNFEGGDSSPRVVSIDDIGQSQEEAKRLAKESEKEGKEVEQGKGELMHRANDNANTRIKKEEVKEEEKAKGSDMSASSLSGSGPFPPDKNNILDILQNSLKSLQGTSNLYGQIHQLDEEQQKRDVAQTQQIQSLQQEVEKLRETHRQAIESMEKSENEHRKIIEELKNELKVEKDKAKEVEGKFQADRKHLHEQEQQLNILRREQDEMWHKLNEEKERTRQAEEGSRHLANMMQSMTKLIVEQSISIHDLEEKVRRDILRRTGGSSSFFPPSAPAPS